MCLIVTGTVFTLISCSTIDVICEPHGTDDVCFVDDLNSRDEKLNFLTKKQSFRDSTTKIQFGWNSNLKTFPTGIFTAYKNLKTLNLFLSRITQIDENTFKDAHELLELNLANNNIGNWKNSSFYGVESLEVLKIYSCNIKEIPEGIFFKLINLRELSLYGNHIVNVPKEVFSKLTKLKKLSLDSNNIKHLDAMTFASLGELTELDLSSNRLTALSPNLFSQNNELGGLDLSWNPLIVVEDSIRTLSKLEYLRLYKNHLTELNSYPESIKVLIIGSNDLKKLFIGKHVEWLDAHENQITDIRATSDSKLKKLQLSGNKLWSEKDINELKQLRNIDAESNPFKPIFESFWKKDSMFAYLSSSSNQLMPNCRKLLMENVSRNFNFSGANITSVYDNCLNEFLCVVDTNENKCIS